MRKKVLQTIYVILFLSTCTYAQTNDSSRVSKRWHQTKFAKIAGVPLAMTAVGLAVMSKNFPVNRFDVQESITSTYPNFSSSVDDYLRYVPPATVYALDLVGVKSKNSFKHRSLIFLKANIIGVGLAFPLKGITQVRRPDNSSSASFPSLHTTQAFIGATFMHKELGHRSVWYSIGAYAVATTTGIFRMLNNKHWMSDVIVGAASGILSTNIAYHTHQYREGKKNRKLKAFVAPSISSRSYGASLVLLVK